MGSCPVQNRTYRNPAKELRLFISSATEQREVDVFCHSREGTESRNSNLVHPVNPVEIPTP
jgi:hypothetical protein